MRNAKGRLPAGKRPFLSIKEVIIMNPNELLAVLHTVERLKDTTRHCYTSQGRHESVAEHSWRVTLMAFLMRDEFPELDMDKVIKMCLIHDKGEAITGDIPAFEKTDKDRRVENKKVEQLTDTLPEPVRAEWKTLFEEMGAMETQEARLYKSLDKLEALIQHNEADISTWIPLEYDLQMTYGNEECKFTEYIQRLRDEVRKDSKRKIEEI